MPRPKKEGPTEAKKTRSRHGCWPCKARKVKCDEARPVCQNCIRLGETCDYSIKLNWEGRSKRSNPSPWSSEHISLMPTPPTSEVELAAGGLNVTKASPPSQYAIGIQTNRSKSSSDVGAKAEFASTYSVDEEQHRTKRQKVSQQPRSEPFDKYDLLPSTDHAYSSISPQPVLQQQQQPFSGFQFEPAAPPTPGPSVFSDDSWKSHSSNHTELPTTRDLRRLSVKSIMNSPVEEDPSLRAFPVPPSNERESVYGLDHGFPDLDIPRNDDSSALIALSPRAVERRKSQPGLFPDDGSPGEFGFGLQPKQNMFERGEYYAKPVVVRIPKSLEPLPEYLMKNPMNLLYFHHFLNHTARMLVPHDCPENPFRNLLPGMAMKDFDLLNLLLAYSACHRARLLNHPDPSNRVATFVEQVFPNLRIALKDPNHKISNSNLATAIMLASLEIISPQAFEIQVSWQEHLTIARQMIVARGGYQTLHREDDVARFLSRWFAYLDVVGSLSGIQYLRPLDLSCLSDEDRSPLKTESGGAPSPIGAAPETPSESGVPDLSTIDCLIGCTGRCVMTLAKVADLAKQCDAQRIGLRGSLNTSWRPSSDMVAQAEKIQAALKSDSPTIAKGCIHHDNSTDTPACGMSEELIAVNDAFHYSGLIHLYRRVLIRPTEDPDVQQAVRGIAQKLDEVRHGGSAEACLIFPMFTAGCEAVDLELREKFLKRLEYVETYGMMQVHRARTLMQRVWDTKKPWFTLATNEFVG